MRKQRASTLSFALSIHRLAEFADGFGIIASLAQLACPEATKKYISAGISIAVCQRVTCVATSCGQAAVQVCRCIYELVPCACTKIAGSPHPSCLVLYEHSQSVKRPAFRLPESGSLAVSLSVHLSKADSIMTPKPDSTMNRVLLNTSSVDLLFGAVLFGNLFSLADIVALELRLSTTFPWLFASFQYQIP